MRYYIVETAENIPYDVMEFASRDEALNYLERYFSAVPENKIIRNYDDGELTYIKYYGAPGKTEYCSTLIEVYQ